MYKSITFNEDQIDALKEFMNISLGEATSNIAELLEAFGTMHIPEISIRDAKELKNVINESINTSFSYYAMKQLFSGKFGGECIFIVDEDSAVNLGNHLYDVKDASDEDINDAVMELTNIAVSSIISRLTEELDVQVQFFAPTSTFIKSPATFNCNEAAQYSKVIVVSTNIDFKDQCIKGLIFVLTKDEAINSLKELIDKKIEELYS